MVDCVGSVDAVDTLLDLERRYHSSGTQKRKPRVAADVYGLAQKEDSMILKTKEDPGSRVDSKDADQCVLRQHKLGITHFQNQHPSTPLREHIPGFRRLELAMTWSVQVHLLLSL